MDAWLDLVTADGLDVEFLAGLLNTDEKVVGDLIAHPLTLITLVGRGRASLAHVRRRLLQHAARQVGAGARAPVARGGGEAPHRRSRARVPHPAARSARARLLGGRRGLRSRDDRRLPSEWVSDLPAGESRFVSRARGVEWSLVNGEPVLERGRVVERPAGARPGQVLRRFDA